MSILAFILHHANRCSKSPAYYKVKDKILKKYGKDVGYDIQHLPGKRCHSCGGTGWHDRYSMYAPYGVYDSDPCWHCKWGWYRESQWVCLQRIKFGKYIFHRPLKREFGVVNPWVENEMGWVVSESPVIEGYIDHHATWFSPYMLLLLFYMYDRDAHTKQWNDLKMEIRWIYIRRRNYVRNLFTWKNMVIEKPMPYINHWLSAKGWNPEEEHLPF